MKKGKWKNTKGRCAAPNPQEKEGIREKGRLKEPSEKEGREKPGGFHQRTKGWATQTINKDVNIKVGAEHPKNN